LWSKLERRTTLPQMTEKASEIQRKARVAACTVANGGRPVEGKVGRGKEGAKQICDKGGTDPRRKRGKKSLGISSRRQEKNENQSVTFKREKKHRVVILKLRKRKKSSIRQRKEEGRGVCRDQSVHRI